jgi:hypothetical protein
MGNGVYPGESDCKNLWGCFKFVMCYGVRAGGGVGEFLKLTIGPRWLIDAMFFVILVVMLLNIIFGIIIDTFSSLRAEKNERMEDTVGVCFICGINDQVFDRASDEPDGFKTHIKLDHNMWNYLYFIFMLWEQDKDDDDGLEQYVRRAIDAHEITWFPLNKALRLEQAATEEEITLREISSEIHAFEDALEKKIVQFQSEMSLLLDTVSQATKLEHAKGNVKDGIAGFIRKSLIVIPANEDGAELSEIGAGSTLLDTIDEDGAALEDGSVAEDSQASGRGLGIVHEGGSDEDEDSDFEGEGEADEVLQRNTQNNSALGLEERGAADNISEPPPSQPAPFPGSEIQVNSMMGGEPVMIREASDRFWGITNSVPSTPASTSTTGRPSMGEPQASYRLTARPETAVEPILEEGHAEVDGAASGGNSRKLAESSEFDALHAAEGYSEEQGAEMVPVTAWDAPPTEGSRPATRSEDVRPDTAATQLSPSATAATAGTRSGTGTGTDSGTDGLTLPSAELAEPAAEVEAEASPVEGDLSVRSVNAAADTTVTDQDDIRRDTSVQETDAPAAREDDTAESTEQFGDAVEEEILPSGPQAPHGEESAPQQDSSITEEALAESMIDGDSVGEGSAFEPEVLSPDAAHVEYLAGDSFRVAHLSDHGSVGAASELHEASTAEDSVAHAEDGAGESDPAVELHHSADEQQQQDLTGPPADELGVAADGEHSSAQAPDDFADDSLTLAGPEDSLVSVQPEASVITDVPVASEPLALEALTEVAEPERAHTPAAEVTEEAVRVEEGNHDTAAADEEVHGASVPQDHTAEPASQQEEPSPVVAEEHTASPRAEGHAQPAEPEPEPNTAAPAGTDDNVDFDALDSDMNGD